MSISRPNGRARLLFVITLSTCGGAQTHVLELLQAAASHFDVGLATGKDGFLADAAREMNVPVFLVPDLIVPLSPDRDANALRSLIGTVKQFRPDLVHAHSSKAGLLARIAARTCCVPSVFSAHGWAFTQGAPWLRRHVALCCERMAVPFTDAIITVSEYDRDLAIKLGIVPRGGVHCIHNGIAEDGYRATPGVADIPIISMVARFCEQKDHATLIRALAGIRSTFRLQLIGDGPGVGQIRKFVQEAGISHCTEFLGERADIPELLSGSNIFALTSHYEGLPISVIEAMRAGLPVIATDVGGVRELVVDGVSGLLAARSNVEQVRAKCESLLASARLCTRMGAAGRQRYEQQFTAARMTEKTFRVYRHVLNGAARHAPTATRDFRIHVHPTA